MGVQHQTVFGTAPGGPGEGPKVKYHLISITKPISKTFIPNFMCVLTNKRYNTYQTGFASCRLGHALGVGLWGVGVPRGGGSKKLYYGHVAYQIDGYDEQNRMKVMFLP